MIPAMADSTPLHTGDATAEDEMQRTAQQQAATQYIVDEDPLLIAQTLTYVTDDGSVVSSFQSAPFSWCRLAMLRRNQY